MRVLGVVEKPGSSADALPAGEPHGQQGWLRLHLERQFDRGNDQHDFGQPLVRLYTNIEAINTARDLLLKTISMGH